MCVCVSRVPHTSCWLVSMGRLPCVSVLVQPSCWFNHTHGWVTCSGQFSASLCVFVYHTPLKGRCVGRLPCVCWANCHTHGWVACNRTCCSASLVVRSRLPHTFCSPVLAVYHVFVCWTNVCWCSRHTHGWDVATSVALQQGIPFSHKLWFDTCLTHTVCLTT